MSSYIGTKTTLRTRLKQFNWSIVKQYAIAFFMVILTTLILFELKPYAGDAKVSLVYLFIVLGTSAVAHPSVTLFCGLWSFLCYDFFLVPPLFDLRFGSPIQVLDPLAFIIVAVVTSALAERSRQHVIEKLTYQKADQLRATLLNLISHNLRTPLATIKTTLTSLLDAEEIAADNKELLQFADEECDRLNRLITNVLQLSRLEAQAIKLSEDWHNLDELIAAVFAHWPQAVANGTLTTDLPPTLPMLSFDFALIEAVLTNLVENAFRHGLPPVRVEVRLHVAEVWISVQDVGPGIPLKDRSQLFGKFFNPKSKGLGLGLSVCKGLIEAHGGHIWAEFLPDKTRFIFSLPLVSYLEESEE